MTSKEAIKKIEFLIDAYYLLINEENVDTKKVIKEETNGLWEVSTPIVKVYNDLITALNMAINALEEQTLMPESNYTSKKTVKSCDGTYSNWPNNSQDHNKPCRESRYAVDNFEDNSCNIK